MRWLSVVGLLTVWLAAGDGMAAVKTWVVGTEQRPWAQSGKITAFDEVSGALQSREYKPYQNILQGLDKRDNEGKTIWLPEGAWQRWHVDFDYVLGEDPRSSYTHQHPFFLDGDPEIGYAALEPARTYKGVRYLFDTGVLVPANRFVFYPQQTGILPRTGVPLREYYMRAYQVSATAKLSQERLTGWGTDPLEVLLGEEPHNFKHVPVIDFPLQPLRVFQLTNLALTGFSLGEIELYGEGFAPEAWYTTEVIDLGAPVNIGRVSWDFKKFRWRKQWQWIGPSSSEELRLQTRAAPELWQVIGGDPEPIEW
ncbi:MAG TPA: hypothetical protein EYP53_10225, partial [Candidatus Latescibacteria bacterium]|nr:hypothetical protein [Candidatus Latescibacterota bacterium]